MPCSRSWSYMSECHPYSTPKINEVVCIETHEGFFTLLFVKGQSKKTHQVLFRNKTKQIRACWASVPIRRVYKLQVYMLQVYKPKIYNLQGYKLSSL